MVHKYLLPKFRDDFHGDSEWLTYDSLNKLVKDFKTRIDTQFDENYEYYPLDFSASTSLYNPETGDFVDEINANLLGVLVDNGNISDARYLYESEPLRYDSAEPELELLKRGYSAKITAFGKLPKKAIQVPKYTGGTTTPDFVYLIEGNDGEKDYLLVETKAENMREGDREIVKIQKKFFDKLKEDYDVDYSVATKTKDVTEKLRKLIEKHGGE
jgi:type III restriction enzyme